MTETAEHSLLARVASGDSNALGALFDRHSADVYRIAYRILGSREEAEDTVQDVFVGLPRALRRYQESNAFLPWLRRVTVRTALIRIRASRRATARDQIGAAPLNTSRDDAMRIDIDDALSSLDPDLRSVVVLRLVAGYSHEEISRTMQISVSASKVRLHRALKQLQKILRVSP